MYGEYYSEWPVIPRLISGPWGATSERSPSTSAASATLSSKDFRFRMEHFFSFGGAKTVITSGLTREDGLVARGKGVAGAGGQHSQPQSPVDDRRDRNKPLLAGRRRQENPFSLPLVSASSCSFSQINV